MANEKSRNLLGFELSKTHATALEQLSGGRQVRLSGRVQSGKFVVDFIACNSPFTACNSPFTACNSPFTACNSPFTACNSPFKK